MGFIDKYKAYTVSGKQPEGSGEYGEKAVTGLPPEAQKEKTSHEVAHHNSAGDKLIHGLNQYRNSFDNLNASLSVPVIDAGELL
jgi:hypothetical protein